MTTIEWRRRPIRVDSWHGLEHLPLWTRLELFLRALLDDGDRLRRASIVVPSSLMFHSPDDEPAVGRARWGVIEQALSLGWRIEYDGATDSYRIESGQNTIDTLHAIEYCLRKTEGAALNLMNLKTREKI